MKSKQVLLPAFLLLVLVQWYVPAKMIWDREDILETGTEYKFRTAPIDPNDPFRGKYIRLNHQENWLEISDDAGWIRGETVFVRLTKDKEGFAKITSVSKEKPTGEEEYLRAKVNFISGDEPKRLMIEYPFDRFYMEESKAPKAEQTYLDSQRDSTKLTYSLVSIKDGKAVLKDVLVDGVSIRDLVGGNY